jgi:hypothetical protein
MKKTPKPDAIPLETLFLDEGFQRNYEIMMREDPGDPKLKAVLTAELISNAARRVKRGQELKQISIKGGNTPKEGYEERETRNALIRQGAKEGITTSNLAKRFGLSPRQINKIIKKDSA